MQLQIWWKRTIEMNIFCTQSHPWIQLYLLLHKKKIWVLAMVTKQEMLDMMIFLYSSLNYPNCFPITPSTGQSILYLFHNFWCHPARCANKRMSHSIPSHVFTSCQPCTYTKICRKHIFFNTEDYSFLLNPAALCSSSYKAWVLKSN